MVPYRIQRLCSSLRIGPLDRDKKVDVVDEDDGTTQQDRRRYLAFRVGILAVRNAHVDSELDLSRSYRIPALLNLDKDIRNPSHPAQQKHNEPLESAYAIPAALTYLSPMTTEGNHQSGLVANNSFNRAWEGVDSTHSPDAVCQGMYGAVQDLISVRFEEDPECMPHATGGRTVSGREVSIGLYELKSPEPDQLAEILSNNVLNDVHSPFKLCVLKTLSQDCRKQYVEDSPGMNEVLSRLINLHRRPRTAITQEDQKMSLGNGSDESTDTHLENDRGTLKDPHTSFVYPFGTANDLDPEKNDCEGVASGPCSKRARHTLRDFLAFISAVPLSAAVITGWDNHNNDLRVSRMQNMPILTEVGVSRIGLLGFLGNPSHTEFALASAIYFVATTLYSRRCQGDVYQGQVIAVALMIGFGCALAFGCDLQTVALSVMSWTIFVALIVSTGVHAAI